MSKQILVADDDPAIVEVLQMILEMDGYLVNTTVEGGTVCKMAKKSTDILLLDIWMSGQDGREICKMLKKDPLTCHLPIILISASKDVQESAHNAGADDFIAKPFEMNELLEKVKRHIKD